MPATSWLLQTHASDFMAVADSCQRLHGCCRLMPATSWLLQTHASDFLAIADSCQRLHGCFLPPFWSSPLFFSASVLQWELISTPNIRNLKQTSVISHSSSNKCSKRRILQQHAKHNTIKNLLLCSLRINDDIRTLKSNSNGFHWGKYLRIKNN